MGKNTVKSNVILSGWAAHNLENNNNKKSSPTVVKVLIFLSGFPFWRFSKGTGNPQGIWLSSPVVFDYRSSTGLEETETTLLEGMESCARQDPGERSSDPIGD